MLYFLICGVPSTMNETDHTTYPGGWSSVSSCWVGTSGGCSDTCRSTWSTNAVSRFKDPDSVGSEFGWIRIRLDPDSVGSGCFSTVGSGWSCHGPGFISRIPINSIRIHHDALIFPDNISLTLTFISRETILTNRSDTVFLGGRIRIRFSSTRIQTPDG